MKNLQNESVRDRIIRVVLGIIGVVAAYSFTTGIVQTILYIIAVILLITGFTGICLIYKILGIRTNK